MAHVSSKIPPQLAKATHGEYAEYIYILHCPAKKESPLLHTYVLNEFLTADRSGTTKYF